MGIKEEIERLEKEIAKLAPISEEADRILDELADLIVDDFFARKAAGTLPKPLKRAKKPVRK